MKNLLDLLDELRALAQTGLNYASDPYDLQRYHRIMALASDQYAAITDLSSDAIKSRFAKELGYITPKVGVQGALFNDAGQILLEKRTDDACWGLPSGWVEVGETPEIAIRREFLEETNLRIEPLKIIGFYTRLPGQYNQPHTSIHLLYWCKYLSGGLKKSFESVEMAFCDHRQVVDWHKDHQQQVEEATNYELSITARLVEEKQSNQKN